METAATVVSRFIKGAPPLGWGLVPACDADIEATDATARVSRISAMLRRITQRRRRSALRLAACLVHRDGGADERLEGLLVDLVAVAEVDGAPCVAFEARIEELRRIRNGCAL